jgi:hypothetical protein
MDNLKNGQYVIKNNFVYMFLGYCDYRKKLCILSDRHGNKHQSFVEDISLYKADRTNQEILTSNLLNDYDVNYFEQIIKNENQNKQTNEKEL